MTGLLPREEVGTVCSAVLGFVYEDAISAFSIVFDLPDGTAAGIPVMNLNNPAAPKQIAVILRAFGVRRFDALMGKAITVVFNDHGVIAGLRPLPGHRGTAASLNPPMEITS